MTAGSVRRTVAGVTKGVLVAATLVARPHRWRGKEPRLTILMYHRVLPMDDPRVINEEPGMIVTPSTFEKHLRWLAGEFFIVDLQGWLKRADDGRDLPARACAITFDDGWQDNYEYAFPILKRHKAPATIFLVSDMIGTMRQFWPNRLFRILQTPELIESIRIGPLRRILEGVSLPIRREEFPIIAARAKAFSDHELNEILSRLDPSSDAPYRRSRDSLNWAEIREMQKSGLVRFGSHTCSHLRLYQGLPPEILHHEIVESGRILRARLADSVDVFCYPNGDAPETAREVVRASYAAAVTTQAGHNTPSTPRHALRRIALHEDISRTRGELLARIAGWR